MIITGFCDIAHIDVDPKNHVGETEIRGSKAATQTEEGYTGDTWCKACGNKIADGTVLPRLDTKPQPEPTNPTYDRLTDAQKQDADSFVSILGVDSETAAQMVRTADKLGVSEDTVKLGGKTILNTKNDKDLKGTDFDMLIARSAKRTETTLTKHLY